METQARIIEIIRRVSQREISFDPEQSLFESGLLDSFTLPDVVSEIEKQFSIQVPDSDLSPQRFDSVARIQGYLEGVASLHASANGEHRTK